jgi:murein DD-endopeptidase MepM/ murein hydrolase activator NlpD
VIIEGIAGVIGLVLSIRGTKKTIPKPRYVIELHPAILSDSKTKLMDRGAFSGQYLERRSPTHLHRGIDIAAPLNTQVYSVQDGKVIGIYPDGDRSGYGKSILILHTDGFSSFYAHLNSVATGLERGSIVYKGEPIGKVGNTGTNSPFTHLHLEILKGLSFRNPRPAISEYTPERESPIEYLRRNNIMIGKKLI